MLKISGQSDPDLQRYLTQTDRQRFLTFIERLSDLEKMLITRKGTNPRIKKTWKPGRSLVQIPALGWAELHVNINIMYISIVFLTLLFIFQYCYCFFVHCCPLAAVANKFPLLEF